MHALLEGFVDLVFPPRCGACERWLAAREPRGAALCESCRTALPWIDAGLCTRCQERLPQAGRVACGRCSAAHPWLSACTAAVRYEGRVEDWVTRFKYPAPGLLGLDPVPLAVLRFLVREAAHRAPGGPPALVLPIPLHPRRLRSRGFNPAALLARAITHERAARASSGLLLRTRDTASQTGLDRRARRRNVRDAFATTAAAPALLARGPVWLVDDVVTTGATLEAAARALRRAGAREIAAVCAARTPEPGEDTRRVVP